MQTKQSVFDTSKETLSLEHNSKMSIKSKSSLIVETEKAKIQQSTKTLDNLIKATQQRNMKRNLVRQVQETQAKKNFEKECLKPPKPSHYAEPSMEIEESIDLGLYQVAGVEERPKHESIKYSEEDTPRCTPPTPEPSETHKNKIQNYRNSIIAQKREQKISSILKSHYTVNNAEYGEVKKEAILVQQEFAEDSHRNKVSILNEQNINIATKYPFRKEVTRLSKFLDRAKTPEHMPSKIEKVNKEIEKSSSQLRPTKSMDLTKTRGQNFEQRHIAGSKSFSRLRQPTPTSSTSRTSLDGVRTNLMLNKFTTLPNDLHCSKPTRNPCKENLPMTSSTGTFTQKSQNLPCNKTPKSRKGVSTKAFIQQRFRF